MTDHDPFDSELGGRLAAAEGRVPGAAAPDPTATRTADRRVPLAIGGVLVAAAVMAVAFLPGMLREPTGDASPTPTASASPSETGYPSNEPSPTPTAAPTPTLPPSGPPQLSWQPAGTNLPDVFDIEWVGDRFVAVNADGGRAAAWTMLPGGSWVQSAPIEPEHIEFQPDNDIAGQSFRMFTVVRLHDELIALGWRSEGCCDSGRAVSWVSDDSGLTWEYIETVGTPFGDTYHFPIEAVLTRQGEIVVLSNLSFGLNHTIWTSTDGRRWTQRPLDLADLEFMTSISAGASRLLAIGGAEGGATGSPRTWSSSDGHAWLPATTPEGAMVLSAVAYDEAEDLFVVAGRGSEGLSLWFTADGATWSDPLVLSQEAAGVIGSVAAADGVIVAAGWTGQSTDTSIIAWALRGDGSTGVAAEQLSSGTSVGANPRVALGADGVATFHASLIEVEGGPLVTMSWHGQVARP